MADEKPKGRKLGFFRRSLGALLAVAGVLIFVPTTLLIVVAETRAGRIFGGIALACLVLTVCLVVTLWRPSNRGKKAWAVSAVLALVTGIGLASILAGEAPATRPGRDFGLQSRFVGQSGVPTYSPMNLVPEIDQVKLGVTLATRFVPWFARARTIRETTMGLYREIDADPESAGLGPVTHFAALQMVGADFTSNHYFAYVPELKPGERLGAIVFLHGNGGNFQVMPWAWRSFAETYRYAIICPTFGFGFWGKGGTDAVDLAWSDAVGRFPIDQGRVYLGGISDGGVGVTRSATTHPGRYRGLIYVSPTMHLDELASPAFVREWADRPILVLQGGRDWSVSKSTVDPAVDLLRRQGSLVDYTVFPDEDHFLFFSKRPELSTLIGDWTLKGEKADPR